MSCPTCDHTMHRIGNTPNPAWWCPRCGTLIDRGMDGVPRLVERVIEFAGHLTDEHEDLISHFERLGVRESITRIE